MTSPNGLSTASSKSKSFARLQFRLTVILIITFLGLLLIYNCVSLLSGHTRIVEAHADYAYALTSTHLSDAITIYDGNVAGNIIRGLENDDLIYRATLKDIDGIILSGFTRSPYGDGSYLNEVYDRFAFIEEYRFDIHQNNDLERKKLGVLILKISSYRLFLDAASKLPVSLIQATFWTLFSVAVVSLVIYYRIAKPITQLSNAIDGIDLESAAHVDLTRIKNSSSHEVKILCTRLDTVLNRAQSILKEKNSQVRNLTILSETDELTKILNRRSFFSHLEADMANGKNYSIIYMDIDHFKAINDAYGHLTGDHVLVETVDAIKHELRDTDRIGRIGGEEFAVQVPATDPAQVVLVAERIRKRVEATIIHSEDFTLTVTISLGACVGHTGIGSVGDMRRLADEALYKAKRNGRNRVIIKEPTTKSRTEPRAAAFDGWDQPHSAQTPSIAVEVP